MPGASMEFNSSDGKPIRRVNVVFEGLKSINSNLLNSYKHVFQGECDFENIIMKAKNVQEELSSLDAFSSVSHNVTPNPGNPLDIDVVFKLRENKKRFTLGSTINKRGKIGFEASAFFPNLFGTLSTSKFSIATFGTSSRELSISHFTPNIFSTNIDMVYNLSKSIVDYNKSSSYTENSFGGLVRFSGPNNHHNLTVESRIREFPRLVHEQIGERLQDCDTDSSNRFFGQSIQTLKNSICYSWNKIKSNHYNEKDEDSSEAGTEKRSNAFYKINSNHTIKQLSVELAGFNGDVSFIKTQGFYTWSSKLSRNRYGFNFLKNPSLDFCLGFGALLPNFINNSIFKASMHDKFFLGGNCGAHYCLPGFAPRSVGPCTYITRAQGKEEDSKIVENRENVYLGGDSFIVSEARISHPLDLSGMGTDVKPDVQAFVGSAIVLDRNDNREKRSVLEKFRQNIRVTTGIGLSVPLGPADLSLLFSAPIKYRSTDTLEGFQLGMRMTYAPL
ncbi:unnamed protein product [Cryptosporidium hominis]|uniref:Bacterial surface antigen (D15) domain-containing protein n=1 Tax=Cryptosporidium hominis TaxID=237895 RepID=A0A0S4TDN2_CRYHO|nr:hypothetical protein ChTU502y2012_387g0025 [Cryptosporidium hominis]PPA63664.1 Surface antigen family protein [Cryptosporidium hominis]CUV04432.1 unnamed protein product [Cryptosporidium hominis]